MRRIVTWGALSLALCLVLPACGGGEQQRRSGRSEDMEGTERPEDDQGRCETEGPDREVSEYDTSGDEYPDVRRVFRRVGTPPLVRLILSCREADLNGDGIKDVVRYYNDEGRPIREESDRNFDGRIDMITFFQDGRVVRQEIDSDYDGRVDTKVFYERGRVVRTERDLAGRSTAGSWRPDRWEYFEDGRMVRMGTDLNGDGTVDRWDRDAQWSEQQRQREASEEEPDEEEDPDGAEDDAG
jgi:hypothetical protein